MEHLHSEEVVFLYGTTLAYTSSTPIDFNKVFREEMGSNLQDWLFMTFLHPTLTHNKKNQDGTMRCLFISPFKHGGKMQN